MFQYNQNPERPKTKTDNTESLSAFSKFQAENKEDFLEIFGKNIERVYREAFCLRELSFIVTDDSVNIFTEITRKIANILHVEKCAIYTFDALNDEFILESPIYGQSTALLKLSRINLSADEMIITKMTSNLLETENIKTIFLKINDKKTGIMTVANKLDKTDFNDEDDYFLNLCANHVAVIIENNRLYRQLQAQAARESVINRINNSIRSSLDLNTILNTTVKEIGATLKVSLCNILRFVPDKNIAVVTHEYNCQINDIPPSVGSTIPIEGSAINSEILKTKNFISITDTSKSKYILDNPSTKYRIIDTIQAKSILAVPIIFENQVLGTISLNQCDRIRKWTKGDVEIVENIASQLGVAMNQAALMSKIKALAAKDELTGLINRRHFYERYISEIERIKRHPGFISFGLFDIDHFKNFNDNYGHLAGDYVLREIGKIVQANIRKSDIAARYGGEEFALVLPETTLEDGYELLERLRKTIEETEFNFQSTRLKVTISGGISQIGPLKEKNADVDYLMSDCIDKTDNLLYKAKKSGRNKIYSE